MRRMQTIAAGVSSCCRCFSEDGVADAGCCSHAMLFEFQFHLCFVRYHAASPMMIRMQLDVSNSGL